jgi:hypothetical protein
MKPKVLIGGLGSAALVAMGAIASQARTYTLK